jgi:hypothetical protein
LQDAHLHLYADARLTSPYVMSVFVSLHEKGLPFELSTVDLGRGENHEPRSRIVNFRRGRDDESLSERFGVRVFFPATRSRCLST